MKLLELKIDDIVRLCRLHKVSKLFAFGSVLKESFNDESDIDLIVDFDQVPIEDYADKISIWNMNWKAYSIAR